MSDDYSPEFLDEMREALDRQRAELINRSHVTRSDLRERERAPGDSIDESVDEQGTSTTLRLKDRERNLLAKINDAMLRIDDGEYGYCDNCGDFIGEARLRARPVAELCIACKEDQEREERRLNQGHPGVFSVLTHQD
jgi:DnaK suppressor protein